MKILVIQRTAEKDWHPSGQIWCEDSRKLQEYWREYQREQQVPFDLEFEFLRGENLCSVGGWTPELNYYYQEKTLLEEVDKRIQEGSIDGILIDPILTEEEELDYKSCNVIRCDTAEEIYNSFANQVPIGFSVPMVCSSLFERTNLYRIVVGNATRNNLTITPIFHLSKFSIFYTPMFRYYVESSLKNLAKSNQDAGRQKRIEKIQDILYNE